MTTGLLKRMAQGLRLRPGSDALSMVLRPLLRQAAQSRALVLRGVSGRWARILLAAGCEVRREDASQPMVGLGPGPGVDILCAAPSDGGDVISLLRELSASLRIGGMLVLFTGRRSDRAMLCAAFLHAGLAAPVQQVAGMTVLTAGRVQPQVSG